MLPSETMIWQPEFTDKTLSRKPGAVQDEEINLILRRLNDVYSVGYRVGDAARRRAIKKALGDDEE
ncbi:hypothetical protein MJ12_005046 [Escherichia coli]|nr:hypothetical protein [Escherichia coli]